MKKIGLLTLCFWAFCAWSLNIPQAVAKQVNEATEETEKSHYVDVRDLSLREQVGQTIMPRLFVGQQALFKDAVLQGEVTGFFIKSSLPFDPTFFEKHTPEEVQRIFAAERQKLIKTISDLKTWARKSNHQIPLLFAIDYEGGQITSPMFMGLKQVPSNMLLGASQDQSVIKDMYAAMAQEILQVGANVAFGPDTDVNSNPQNPIIQARSFGAEAGEVGRKAAAAVRALQMYRVPAFIKHFPGHGDTSTDTHNGETHSDLKLQDVWSQHLNAFIPSIRGGVKGVMSAHVMYKALDEGVNASFSPKILKNILQKKLGFRGVIATDGLDMGAVSGIEVEEIVRRAYKAGNHLLLLTSSVENPQDAPLYARRAADFVLRNVSEGGENNLSEKDIQVAAGKILALKRWMRLFDGPAMVSRGTVNFEENAARAAREGVTLVRDEQNLLPLSKEETSFCSIFFAQPVFRLQLEKFNKVLSANNKQVASVFLPVKMSAEQMADYSTQIKDCIHQAQVVVVGTSGAAKKEALPEQYQLASEALEQAAGKKTVLLSLVSPYDIVLYPQAKTVLALYGPTVDTTRVAAQILLGELQPKGHLPIKLAL